MMVGELTMNIRNFNLIMMIIAGIIVTIISIIFRYSLNQLMYTLIIVLVSFFFIGSIIQSLLNSIDEKAENIARQKEKALLDEEVDQLINEDVKIQEVEDES